MKTLILKRRAFVLSMMLAFIGAMTLTQCKKEKPVEPESHEPESQGVFITLDVSGGNDSRVDVNTSNGAVSFAAGDKILVGSDGKYVGTLTYDLPEHPNLFSGNIDNAVSGQKLYFYLLGNKTPAETLTAGSTASCSVNIGDQTQYLPVISCAPSKENYPDGTENPSANYNFTATLRNKSALVKFKTNVISSIVTLSNMYNKANVNFAEGTITPAESTGSISFATDANGEGWAILLPHDGAITATASATGYSSATVTIPAISNNDYLSNGIAVSLEAITIPDGAIGGLFTINGNGDQVYFSQGNLQWSGNNGWRFALHQYDFIGNAANNTSPTASNDNYMDLFCWGATGLNGVAPNTTNSYYTGGNNLSGVNDWGSNAIINGGNTTNSGWYTLSIAEWHYLFFDRTDANNKFGLATVNGVCGIIILPDDYSGSNITPFDFVNYDNNSWSYNVYSGEGWIAMENSGVVFLPAAGFRNGTNFFEGLIEGIGGSYWSSTSGNGGDVACCIVFNVMNFIAYDFVSYVDYHGMSVRLVRNANSAK